MTELSGWENFYVIIGSSAGALIGLQFVVITLMADIPIGPGAVAAGEAFGTPTVVHFGAALLLSAIASAPWQSVRAVTTAWGVVGAAGLVYSLLVRRRMRVQTAYRPQFEDWLFHAVLPFVAYAMLAGAAWAAGSHLHIALFVIAAAALLLLFVGIHNAWDAVTYHVFVQRRKEHKQ